MNMPGFTAGTSLYTTGVHYRAMAGTPNAQTASALTLCAARGGGNVTAIVDCNTFPDSSTCHECNATGPATFDCCQLGGMRNPGDDCIILNDPNANPLVRPPLPGWWYTSASGIVSVRAL
jgi:hypothetical protein